MIRKLFLLTLVFFPAALPWGTSFCFALNLDHADDGHCHWEGTMASCANATTDIDGTRTRRTEAAPAKEDTRKEKILAAQQAAEKEREEQEADAARQTAKKKLEEEEEEEVVAARQASKKAQEKEAAEAAEAARGAKEKDYPAEDFGVEQESPDSMGTILRDDPEFRHAYELKLKEAQIYARNFVNRRIAASWDLDQMTLALCKNRHKSCTAWAVQGQCEDIPQYMRVRCAPACFSCDLLAAPATLAVPSSGDTNDVLDRGGDFGVLQNVVVTEDNPSMIKSNDLRESIRQTRDYLKRARRLSTLDQELVDICRNQHPECTFWSMVNECENNPTFMKTSCAAACKSCGGGGLSKPPKVNIHARFGTRKLLQAWPLTDLERGADMGVPQLLHPKHPEETILSILDSRMHIRYSTFDQTLLAEWKNEDESCTKYAMDGECNKNPKWMHVHCAPACKTCEAMAEERQRCARDPGAPMGWKPGDLNLMFERLIDEPYASLYDVQVLSSPSTTGGPFVIQLEDVISDDEANRLIAAANKDGYGDQFFRKNFRTAKIATCQHECYEDEIVQRVSGRVHALTGFNDSNCEYLHLPRYESDQFFALHSDYEPLDRDRKQGVRMLTFYVYLNDVEAGGGGTHFNHLNITVLPKKGRALVWPSVLNDSPHDQDERMSHQGLAPEDGGVKYGMAFWYHMHDYKAAEALGCAIL